MDIIDFGDSSSHESIQPTEWTMEENKLFHCALEEFHPDSPNFYQYVASRVPSKSTNEIKEHYLKTIEAVAEYIPVLVNRNCDKENSQQQNLMGAIVRTESASAQSREGKESSGQESCRGIPWTTNEHNLFLMGLEKLGRGDWKNIARTYVITKTPTQVASHAQKYFRRQNSSTPKERRRPSIHDIQKVNKHLQTSLHQHQNNNNQNECFGTFHLRNQIQFSNSFFKPDENQNQITEACPPMNQNQNQVINENECFDTYSQLNGECSTLNRNQNHDNSIKVCSLMNQNDGFDAYPSINQIEYFSTFPLLNDNQNSGVYSTLNQNQGFEAYTMYNGFENFGNISEDQNCRTLPINTELEVVNNHDQNQTCDAYIPYMMPFNGNNQWS